MGKHLSRPITVAALTSTVAIIALATTPQSAQAVTITTNFDDIAEGTDDFTIGSGAYTATFSGTNAQVDSLGLPALYASPPQAYVVTGAGSGGSTTEISFSNPFDIVSFTAVNGGNGQALIEVFDSSDSLLTSAAVTASNANAIDALFTFEFDEIASIVVTNPGAASPPAPPYITAIDNFSATKVPEPASVLGFAFLGGLGFIRKRITSLLGKI